MQENVEYIPNDIRLVFGDSSFLLVTGPNMGGE
jgi:DNA mismatch repair ATPase MutS